VNRPESWRAEPDGRRQRTLRTRAAILDALIELVAEGVMRPTARQIAARAKVAMRSIGQHFPSREQLLAAAAMQLGTKIPRGEPVDPSLPLPERIAAFVASRAIFLEASRVFRGASMAFAPESPTVVQALDAFTKARRLDVGRVFATELAALDADERAVLFDALDLAVCGRMWDGLREELGLDIAAAQARVLLTVRALLRSA